MVKESILHTKNSTRKTISFKLGSGIFKEHLHIGIPYFNDNIYGVKKTKGIHKNGRNWISIKQMCFPLELLCIKLVLA